MIENIKKEIGQRITKVRKEKLGITIKELASRTNGLSAQRISNWEQGTRSPGPMEAKQLADVLEVSASYLLCLTSDPEGEIHSANAPISIPVLETQNAHLYADQENKNLLLVDNKVNTKVKKDCFALIIDDASMEPLFKSQDLVILSPTQAPQPGQFVLAYIASQNKSLLRQYTESGGGLFQLHPSNEMWATISVEKSQDAKIIGTVIEHRQYY